LKVVDEGSLETKREGDHGGRRNTRKLGEGVARGRIGLRGHGRSKSEKGRSFCHLGKSLIFFAGGKKARGLESRTTGKNTGL